MTSTRVSTWRPSTIAVGAFLAGVLGTPGGAVGQALKDVKPPDTPLPTDHFRQRSFESCQALIGRLKAAGGQAEMLDPADRGIRGNSHMIMQDKNHLQIADFIVQWIDQRVAKRRPVRK